MQYSVPQFIEVEDKIIGPLSLKQFLIVLAGGLIDFAIYGIFKLGLIFFALGIPVMLVAIIMAWGKFNGRPLLANAPFLLQFFVRPRYRVFSRQEDSTHIIQTKVVQQEAELPVQTEQVSSRLKKLAYYLDQKAAEEDRLIQSGSRPDQWLNQI